MQHNKSFQIMQVPFSHMVIICQVSQFLQQVLKQHAKKMGLMLNNQRVVQLLLDQCLLKRLRKVNKISTKKQTTQDLEIQLEASVPEDLFEIKMDIVENQMKELQQIMLLLQAFKLLQLIKKTNVKMIQMMILKKKIIVHQVELEESNRYFTQTKVKAVLMK